MQPFTESPHSRCEFYRRMCSLPTVVDPQTGRITMKAGSLVGAVMMPTGLAQQVKNSLDLRGVAPLSIIGHPSAGMWTFLVRADMRPIADPAEVAQLRNARVVVIRDGDIALPSPVPDQLMIRTWISPATGTFRPSGEVVIECARALLPRTDRK
ncbi:DNA-directed RNA polymerase subunit beta [Nocardia asteroides NBRC 15531]|uniref:DNA-directed RNA polymerase subunit beta n=1 Tax=Nocardia asteroides TaxID=1824 RepID=UPI0011086C91|nr:DNA-directed RNA polymerase subunit beta [Nocardia asteroides]TLF63370.1 DNA-directed RNA polymerase subunit beta [Nocardia asteroides NBRC 15531]